MVRDKFITFVKSSILLQYPYFLCVKTSVYLISNNLEKLKLTSLKLFDCKFVFNRLWNSQELIQGIFRAIRVFQSDSTALEINLRNKNKIMRRMKNLVMQSYIHLSGTYKTSSPRVMNSQLWLQFMIAEFFSHIYLWRRNLRISCTLWGPQSETVRFEKNPFE